MAGAIPFHVNDLRALVALGILGLTCLSTSQKSRQKVCSLLLLRLADLAAMNEKEANQKHSGKDTTSQSASHVTLYIYYHIIYNI